MKATAFSMHFSIVTLVAYVIPMFIMTLVSLVLADAFFYYDAVLNGSHKCIFLS